MRTKKSELQRLKPLGFLAVYVVAQATTHKDSRVLTLTLVPRPTRFLELSDGFCSHDSQRFWSLHTKHTGSRGVRGVELLAVDDAGFHYEGNFFERGNVFERIAGDGDDVRLIAGLECADLILPS